MLDPPERERPYQIRPEGMSGINASLENVEVFGNFARIVQRALEYRRRE